MSSENHGKEGYHRFRDPDSGECFGSFEIFWDDPDYPVWGGDARNYDSDGSPVLPGWYWWPCFPGCLPDGDAQGPFDTSEAAYADAMTV